MWEPVPVETECDNECGIAGFEGKRMQVQANAGGNSKLNEWECCRAGHQTMGSWPLRLSVSLVSPKMGL
jgi:hypothetical protein